ncbi:hypothetical protein MMC25_004423 [Agyrium rufum]|nr:hypothetical protein [Agyrium rufum]
MSFLRHRLSRVFQLPSDETSTVDRQESSYSSKIDVARLAPGSYSSRSKSQSPFRRSVSGLSAMSTRIDASPEPIPSSSSTHFLTPSRSSLNKVAAESFRSLAESIRARTSLFYVQTSPSRPSSRSSNRSPAPGPDLSSYHRRSSILRSLKKRHSGRLTPEEIVEAPPEPRTEHPSLPHELLVPIPSSSLLDSTFAPTLIFHDHARSMEDCSGFEYNAQRNNSTSTGAWSTLCSPSELSRRSTLATLVSHSSTSTTHEKESFYESQRNSQDDSSRVATSFYSFDPSRSLLMPSTESFNTFPDFKDADPEPREKKSKMRGSLSVKGVDYPPSFWTSPYRKAIQDLSNPAPETLDTNIESVSLDSLAEQNVSNYPDIFEEVDLASPSVRKSQKPEEDFSALLNDERIPSMGSRTEWDQIHAERDQRYQATQVLLSETESDTECDSELQLCPYPQSTFRRASKTSIHSIDEPVQDPAMLFPRVPSRGFISMNDSASFDQSTLRHVLNEYFQVEIESVKSPEESLSRKGIDFLVEAIERDSAEDLISISPLVEALENSQVISPVALPYRLRTDFTAMYSRVDDRLQVEETDDTRTHALEAPIEAGEMSINEESTTEARVLSRTFQGDQVELESSNLSSLQPASLENYQHIRSFSGVSEDTTDSCAVTTHSPLCYRPVTLRQSYHARTSAVRRTSSLVDEMHNTMNEEIDDMSNANEPHESAFAISHEDQPARQSLPSSPIQAEESTWGLSSLRTTWSGVSLTALLDGNEFRPRTPMPGSFDVEEQLVEEFAPPFSPNPAKSSSSMSVSSMASHLALLNGRIFQPQEISSVHIENSAPHVDVITCDPSRVAINEARPSEGASSKQEEGSTCSDARIESAQLATVEDIEIIRVAAITEALRNPCEVALPDSPQPRNPTPTRIATDEVKSIVDKPPKQMLVKTVISPNINTKGSSNQCQPNIQTPQSPETATPSNTSIKKGKGSKKAKKAAAAAKKLKGMKAVQAKGEEDNPPKTASPATPKVTWSPQRSKRW